jgi:hypothetical protein
MGLKIAILVAGEFREHVLASKSWTSLKYFDCDFFFATWDYSRNNSPLMTKEGEVKISDIHLPRFTFQLFNEEKEQLTSNCAKMIFLWRKVIALFQKSNTKYHAVFLIRPDIRFDIHTTAISFLYRLQENFIYPLSFYPNINHIDDIFIVAKPETLVRFIDSLPYQEITPSTTVHNWLYKVAIDGGFNLSPSRGIHRVTVVRPTCVDGDSTETIFEKNQQWFFSKYTPPSSHE